MQFTVTSLTRCAGGNHFQIAVSIQGGPSGTIHALKADVDFDPQKDLTETREKIIDRVRSAAKEANATTFAQIQTAVVGKNFRV